ncbi:hypothetical protein [Candidatus Foliamicus sp.]
MNPRSGEPSGQTPEGGAPLAGDSPCYFDDPLQDAMMNMILELSAQLWMSMDRLYALEDLLASQGVVKAAALDDYKPDAARAAALKARRERFTHDILRDLKSLTENEAAPAKTVGNGRS